MVAALGAPADPGSVSPGLRHHAVGVLLGGRHYEGIRECLRPIGDLERVLAVLCAFAERVETLALCRPELVEAPWDHH